MWGGLAPAPHPLTARSLGQETVNAVSSTTNDVCNETSSVPVNSSVTVWPAKAETSNDF
jgi:hypothetical protein